MIVQVTHFRSISNSLPTKFSLLSMATFKQLVRFAVGDQTHYGELINTDGNKYTVQQFDGTPFDKLLLTDKTYTVTDVCYTSLATTLTQISQ